VRHPRAAHCKCSPRSRIEALQIVYSDGIVKLTPDLTSATRLHMPHINRCTDLALSSTANAALL
jgi:hypothetical protein